MTPAPQAILETLVGCLVNVVKFLVIHAVHDGHQALQPFHALLITHLSIAPLTSPKYRTQAWYHSHDL